MRVSVLRVLPKILFAQESLEREALAQKSPSNSDESEDDGDGPASRRKHRKHHKSKPLPSWVNNASQKKKYATMIFHNSMLHLKLNFRRRLAELSDHEKSDDDFYQLDDSSQEKLVEKTPQPKRRREQSRSPSLTPPPPVPSERLEYTNYVLRCISTPL